MNIVWTARGLDRGELEEYLRDAIRGPSFLTAEPLWVRRPLWRGTASVEEVGPPVQSWASRRKIALSFGQCLKRRNLHPVLAVIVHRDGDATWIEYLTLG